jgi:hypothetical protein
LFDADTASMGRSDTGFVLTPARNQIDLPSEEHIARKTSFRDRPLFKLYSKKVKKHPSPSKVELAELEQALKAFPAFGTSDTLRTSNPSAATEDAFNNVNSIFPVEQLLVAKDSNLQVGGAVQSIEKKTSLALFPKRASMNGPKPDISRSSVAIPINRRQPERPIIPRPKSELERKPCSSRKTAYNASAMDVDELQWDNSNYNIGK